MPDGYHIHVNFLPVRGHLPAYRIFRQLRSEEQAERPSPDLMSYSLPLSEKLPDASDEQEHRRDLYWVSVQERPDFESFLVQPEFNRDLTRWLLFKSLCDSAKRELRPEQYRIPKGFIRELSLIMESHPEGDELLVVQPYFLRVTQQFGCLVDFHFRLKDGVPFSRRIQQLSLSLDRNSRRNLDYYVDRTSLIHSFVKARSPVLSNLLIPGSRDTLNLNCEFTPLPAGQLRSKVYLFASGRDSRSQFTGLRDYGPLTPLTQNPRLLFMFRERDRQAARTLAVALRGTHPRTRFTFPGFSKLFKTDLEIDREPVVVTDFTSDVMEGALSRVKAAPGLIVPVLILPEDDDTGYLTHKSLFTQANVPTQVCTIPVIQDDNALKWSIANIALQIFCKAGGQPWKVRPTEERSLIIGISQSHRVRRTEETTTVLKHFAFSVMTDSSGLFQKLQVLGDAERQEDYLQQLRQNLSQVLKSSSARFARVVIHTSFKLKHREIDAIQQTVREAAALHQGCHFAVIKINHRSRFFGINKNVNSLVPYEGTVVMLGKGEYLVWFEGVYAGKPNVTKVFPGPTHLQFLRISEGSSMQDSALLQDLINLSGANWRGFNAKSAPVSVFYCHLVADLVHEFHERGLPLPAVQDLKPWFL